MAASFDVCIRGAGIVGRALALLLARERLQVALVVAPGATTAGQSAPDVRAYAISPAVRAVLESVRGWPADALAATPVLAMQVHGDSQGAVHFSAAEQGAPALNWIMDVPALERQLEQACHYQGGITLVAEPVSAPLTVICEGRASRTRAALGVDYEAVRYTQQAIATRAECERPHGQIARQWFTADGDILALLPMGGPQGKEVAVVWSVQQTRLADVLADDEAAFAGQLQALSGDALGALRLTAPRAHWALMLARATRWVGAMPGRRGSFALAGDAAHAMHPLAGQGVNFGLGDAAELARVIAAREAWRGLSDLKLLRRYERARQAQWLRFAAATDGLQRLFTQPEPGFAWLRNQGMQLFDRCAPVKSFAARAAMGLC